ncbi:hypothetical protein KW791_01140 [Candidatus Parcubacteria bacterium]|nr:hypothetical protein [Candidatus Parcubacteria bacterium]
MNKYLIMFASAAVVCALLFFVIHKPSTPLIKATPTPVATKTTTPGAAPLPITSSTPKTTPKTSQKPSISLTPNPTSTPNPTFLPTQTPSPTSSPTPVTPSSTPTSNSPVIQSLSSTSVRPNEYFHILGTNFMVNGVSQIQTVKIGEWSVAFGVQSNGDILTSMQVSYYGIFNVSIISVNGAVTTLPNALTVRQ